MIRQLLAAATLAIASTATFGQVGIEQIAPENSVLVLGVRSSQDVLHQLRSHPAVAMWTGQAMNGDDAAAAGALVDLLPAPLPSMLRQMKQNGQELPRHQGPAGFAMFTALNPEIGMPEPQFLAYADFGDQGGVFMERLSAMLENAAGRTGVMVQRGEIDGAPVISLKLPEPEPEAMDLNDDPMMGGAPMDPLSMMMPSADRFRFDVIHIARTGPSVVVGSDRASLQRSLSAVTGDGPLGVVADNRAFQGVRKQIGESDVYGVVVMRDLMGLVLGPEMMGMAMMFQPMMRAVFGEVQALGYGMSIGEAADLATQRFTVYMPNGKQGIAALMDKPLPRMEPPGFVNGDVIGFSAINLDFSRVVPMIQGLLQSNPMMQAQFAEQWAQMRPQLAKTMNALGSRAYVVQTVDETSPQGMGMLVAVESAAPDQLRASIGEFASKWSMEVREVEGGTMYIASDQANAAPGNMGGPMMGMARPDMAFAVGGEFLFMGVPGQVAAALRRPPAADGDHQHSSTLHRSMTMLPDEPLVAWGFTDPSRLVEIGQAMGGGRMGPAVDPRMLESLGGLSVWYMTSTPDGFVSVSKQIPAPQAVHVEPEVN